ncbi:MAG: DUF7544 domain-containing protein [Chloroflexota bacterium]
MDYGALISRSWRLTWRYRFLWLLGLVAPTTVGSCSGSPSAGSWRTDGREIERTVPNAQQAADTFGTWLAQNFGLVTAFVLLVALVGVAVFIISMIAQGGMARATTEIGQGRQITLGQAWEAGLHFFWRFLGLWLLLIVLGIAVTILVLVIGGAFFAGAFLGGDARGPVIVIGVLLAIVAVLVAIPVGIAVTIAVAYAQRVMVVEDVGPWSALGTAFGLLRRRLGASLVLWLISLALGIGVGIILGIAAVVLLIPLGGVGALLFISTGVSAASLAYAVVAAITFVGLLWFVGGIANTFFWHFWSLSYLQLTGRAEQGPPAQEA